MLKWTLTATIKNRPAIHRRRKAPISAGKSHSFLGLILWNFRNNLTVSESFLKVFPVTTVAKVATEDRAIFKSEFTEESA